MKRVIRGKMYNTETATCHAGYEVFRNRKTFGEALYSKRNGEFFLFKYVWGSREALDTIYPLTDEEAKAWCEEKALCEVYMELFG